MTSKPAVKPTYNPTSDELKSAISVALKHESPTNPTAKEILASLQTEHPTWKLPERRVAKFYKKQKATLVADSVTHDDDSAASHSSRAQRVAHSTKKKIGKLFKKKSKTKMSTDGSSLTKTPPTLIQTDIHMDDSGTAATNLISPIGSMDEGDMNNNTTDTTKEVETIEKAEIVTPEKEDDARDLSVVYEDDNDESKDDQFCGNLCVIL